MKTNLPPRIGLGTYLIDNDECLKVCREAIIIGYRHIDTASGYNNEKAVGTAVKEATTPYCGNASSQLTLPSLKREDIFITTKLSPTQLRLKSSDVNSSNSGISKVGKKVSYSEEEMIYSAVINALQDSLTNLQTTYVDCYMMHWPGIGGLRVDDIRNASKRQVAWRAMCDLKAQGLCKLIAVSNFEIRHFESLRQKPLSNLDDSKSSINEESKPYKNFQMPDMHQLELHPLCRQQEVVEYCWKNNISVQQYSPLGSAAGKDIVLSHPSVTKAYHSIKQSFAKILDGVVNNDDHPYVSDSIYTFANITPAQTVLLWGLVCGGVNPRGTSLDSMVNVCHNSDNGIVSSSCEETNTQTPSRGANNNNNNDDVKRIRYDSLVVRTVNYERLKENFDVLNMLAFLTSPSMYKSEDDSSNSNNGSITTTSTTVSKGDIVIDVFRKDVLSALYKLNNETYPNGDDGDTHMCWSSNKIVH